MNRRGFCFDFCYTLLHTHFHLRCIVWLGASTRCFIWLTSILSYVSCLKVRTSHCFHILNICLFRPLWYSFEISQSCENININEPPSVRQPSIQLFKMLNGLCFVLRFLLDYTSLICFHTPGMFHCNAEIVLTSRCKWALFFWRNKAHVIIELYFTIPNAPSTCIFVLLCL